MELLNKKFKYIVSDVDGTIAGKNLQIDEQVYQALQMYQLASDYHLCLASGRLDIMTKEYIDRLDLRLPIISCNGALIRDLQTNEILFERAIDDDIAIRLLTIAQQRNYDITMYTANMIYGAADATRIKVFHNYNEQLTNKGYAIPFDTQTDYLSLLKEGRLSVIKILFSFNPDDQQQYKEFVDLVTPFAHATEWVISQPGLFDINAQGINKAAAFLKLCELRGFKPEEFISYGDNYNDVELAKVAGYPVAMGHGVAPLKAIAQFITDDIDHHGVANHIHKFVLGDQLWTATLPSWNQWKNKY